MSACCLISVSVTTKLIPTVKRDKPMKKRILLLTGLSGLFLMAMAANTFASDEVTIKGEGKCGKCALKETAKCQNVIQVEENGKTVNYYLAKNEVSTSFHENLCKESKKVTATGTVKEVDGKKEFTATKLELVK